MSRPQVGWLATISGGRRCRIARQGPAQDQLLHVAARQARDGRVQARAFGAAHVEALHQRGRANSRRAGGR
jgi:hypothetical protein